MSSTKRSDTCCGNTLISSLLQPSAARGDQMKEYPSNQTVKLSPSVIRCNQTRNHAPRMGETVGKRGAPKSVTEHQLGPTQKKIDAQELRPTELFNSEKTMRYTSSDTQVLPDPMKQANNDEPNKNDEIIIQDAFGHHAMCSHPHQRQGCK